MKFIGLAQNAYYCNSKYSDIIRVAIKLQIAAQS